MTITLNGQQHDIRDGATAADAVALLAKSATGCAVAINDEVIPRTDWASRPLATGDRVEVLTAVQGG